MLGIETLRAFIIFLTSRLFCSVQIFALCQLFYKRSPVHIQRGGEKEQTITNGYHSSDTQLLLYASPTPSLHQNQGRGGKEKHSLLFSSLVIISPSCFTLPSSVPSVVLMTTSVHSKLQCFQPCCIRIWHSQKVNDCQREESTADSKLSLLHGSRSRLWERCTGTAWRKWRRAQQAAKPSLASHRRALRGKPPTIKAGCMEKTRLSGNMSKDECCLQEKTRVLHHNSFSRDNTKFFSAL